jgi:hypothetical protein
VVLFHFYAARRVSPEMPDILHFSRIGLLSGFMKKWVQKLRVILSSAFPSAASPYWRALPIRRMKSLLAGVFFSTAVVGFAGDLVQLNVQPLGRGFFWPAFFGAGAAVGLVATIERVRSPVLIFIVVCWIGGGLAGLGWLGLGWFTYTISLLVTPWPMPQAMKARIVFDAIGITISGGLGFRLLLSFVTHEGLANVRMQTELALAHGIQARLVPDIRTRCRGSRSTANQFPARRWEAI